MLLRSLKQAAKVSKKREAPSTPSEVAEQIFNLLKPNRRTSK